MPNAKCWFLTKDGNHMSNHHPFGYTKLGTPYRPNGSPKNFAGDGEEYLKYLAKRGETRYNYHPNGDNDSRTFEEATITIKEYNRRVKAGEI